jgi:DNA polymerase bacteriophage-type
VTALRTHFDFETRSLADLRTIGADTYAQHYSTQPIMAQFKVPGYTNGVEVFDILLTAPGYQKTIYPFAKPGDLHYRMVKPLCPPAILAAIERGDTFVAHNARFEQAIWYWICHKLWGWPNPVKWSCTAARARYWGLRASLDGAGSDLEILFQKDDNGKQFINDFCKPRKYKGAKKLGIVKELWYEPQQNSAGWQLGLVYGGRDVEAAEEIDAVLPDLPDFEQATWELDFKMNTRGLPVDIKTVQRALEFSSYYTDIAFKRFDEITSLRPTQRDRVLGYINQREDIENLGDLRSKTLTRLTKTDLPADLREIIDIRLETSQASIKKLETMVRCTDSDGFARGLFLYGGAHTMRWSAKRIQPQNFKRGDAKTQSRMFDFLDFDGWNDPSLYGHNGGPPLDELPNQPEWMARASIMFPRPLRDLSMSMRGFIAAPKGKKIVSGDYAQIEARVLAWLARCMWLLEAFRNGDDVYTRFAGDHMYNRDYSEYFEFSDGVKSIKKQYKRERQVAKSAVLGCGYGLGARKFVEYCDNMDLTITQEESDKTIAIYRDAHVEIADYETGLWSRVGRAAIMAVANENSTIELARTGITFKVHRLDTERFWLLVTLPSGRHIAYYRPKIRLGTKWGRTVEILSFRKEWNGKSYREDTYGGKLVENIVQGTARDICAQGALNAEAAGFPVHGLVHDEIITMPDDDFYGHDELCRLMCDLPAWITDLPVEADGGTMMRYGK